LHLARRRRTAIRRAVALILTRITGEVPTNRRWAAVDFAVATVFAALTSPIAAAVALRWLEAWIAVHRAVALVLAARAGVVAAAVVATTATRTAAVLRTRETVLAIALADAVPAAATTTDAIVRTREAILAVALTDAVPAVGFSGGLHGFIGRSGGCSPQIQV